MGVLFIGDVHSNALALEKVEAYMDTRRELRDYSIVCLGDIFDWRDPSNPSGGNSVKTFEIVRRLEEKYRMETVQSNHQWILMRNLKGHNNVTTKGLSNTIRDFKLNGKPGWRKEVLEWLGARPYYLLKEKYFIAHAYADNRILTEEGAINKRRVKTKAIFGLKRPDGSTVEWWKNPRRGEKYVRVAGHYSVIYRDPYSLLVDGASGEEGGRLATYDSVKDEFLFW